MQLSDLTYISSRSVMAHVHGKEYPIKKHKDKERYYIQHATGQLTVTSLMKGIPFDGSMADYVFNGWFNMYEYQEYQSFAQAELNWI
jgi:hypothetical protein